MPELNKKTHVQAECESCGATGIYRGMAEPEGVGVICLVCKGTGAVKLEYTPFTARKRRKDVRTVQRSAGTFIAGPIGPTGKSVTYSEFLEGILPGHLDAQGKCTDPKCHCT